jgi:hypothetical protein
MEQLSASMTAAAVISFLIGFLKKQSWFPWLTAETAKANRASAFLLSGAAALGVHATFNHAAGQLIISGLSWAAIGTAAYHWVSQFAFTHGWFKATSASDQILAVLKTLIENQQARAVIAPNPAIPPA